MASAPAATAHPTSLASLQAGRAAAAMGTSRWPIMAGLRERSDHGDAVAPRGTAKRLRALKAAIWVRIDVMLSANSAEANWYRLSPRLMTTRHASSRRR